MGNMPEMTLERFGKIFQPTLDLFRVKMTDDQLESWYERFKCCQPKSFDLGCQQIVTDEQVPTLQIGKLITAVKAHSVKWGNHDDCGYCESGFLFVWEKAAIYGGEKIEMGYFCSVCRSDKKPQKSPFDDEDWVTDPKQKYKDNQEFEQWKKGTHPKIIEMRERAKTVVNQAVGEGSELEKKSQDISGGWVKIEQIEKQLDEWGGI